VSTEPVVCIATTDFNIKGTEGKSDSLGPEQRLENKEEPNPNQL